MQSLAPYMGLHMDIDAAHEYNKKIPGIRKNGALVNQGDKLTKEEKVRMIAENRLRFGLSREYID